MLRWRSLLPPYSESDHTVLSVLILFIFYLAGWPFVNGGRIHYFQAGKRTRAQKAEGNCLGFQILNFTMDLRLIEIRLLDLMSYNLLYFSGPEETARSAHS